MTKTPSVPAAPTLVRRACTAHALPTPRGMGSRRLKTLALCCVTVALVCGPSPDAMAAEANKSKKTSVKLSRSPAEETKAERDRRLYRECAGRPNAGACLGYTRKP